MESHFSNVLELFQGISTLVHAPDPKVAAVRVGLILLGFLLIYLGRKGILEALLMLPMGLGMIAVNAGVFFGPERQPITLFLDPLAKGAEGLMTILQIDWLQPVYTFTFSNGLIYLQ